jgi:hypothetical protein
LSISSNFIVVLFIFSACITNTKPYNSKENIEYNTTYTKNIGGYVDTCMGMILKDIQNQGLSLGDFRILSIGYEDALNTIPKDSTGKYYSFEIIYSITNSENLNVRAASYLINFKGMMNKIYDVDANSDDAKEQIESLKKNLAKIKLLQEKIKDTSDIEFKELRERLKSLN